MIQIRMIKTRPWRYKSSTMFKSFEHSIFGFRIYHTRKVHNINFYRIESVPGPLDPGIYVRLA
jgi:hypothetical protein